MWQKLRVVNTFWRHCVLLKYIPIREGEKKNKKCKLTSSDENYKRTRSSWIKVRPKCNRILQPRLDNFGMKNSTKPNNNYEIKVCKTFKTVFLNLFCPTPHFDFQKKNRTPHHDWRHYSIYSICIQKAFF